MRGPSEGTPAHAAVIANVFTPARAAELSGIEDRLVAVARTETPKVLGGVVGRFTDAIDGDGGAESEEERYRRRRYHGSRGLDDMYNVNALYDPESADIHEKAIAANSNGINARTIRARCVSGRRTRSRTCSANH